MERKKDKKASLKLLAELKKGKRVEIEGGSCLFYKGFSMVASVVESMTKFI